MAAQGDEHAARSAAGVAGAQRVEREVEFEPAQQRALAAARRTEQHQRRGVGRRRQHLAQLGE
ncbi:MAG TPA: hypothetical protein PLO14_04125 [Accumulibacter sp.]|nr:hypothetical protein [Accumulibacter sp.]MCM8598792.1 hypothetical protein [Accumulibacter sp.]HNC51418.1 hypothetical protein [Accumulibacter sp.]